MLNKVHLIGRVGTDPITKEFGNGGKSTNIRLATTEKYRDKDGLLKEDTQWHVIVSYGKTAENIEKIIKKGQLISVDGKIKYLTQELPDNVKKYYTQIVALKVLILSNPKNTNGNEGNVYNEEVSEIEGDISTTDSE
jgi:single-strand DNA-binding protein